MEEIKKSNRYKRRERLLERILLLEAQNRSLAQENARLKQQQPQQPPSPKTPLLSRPADDLAVDAAAPKPSDGTAAPEAADPIEDVILEDVSLADLDATCARIARNCANLQQQCTDKLAVLAASSKESQRFYDTLCQLIPAQVHPTATPQSKADDALIRSISAYCDRIEKRGQRARLDFSPKPKNRNKK